MSNATPTANESGVRHWTLQHHLSVANLLLGTWLAVSMVLLPDFNFPTIGDWLTGTIPSLALILLIVTLVWHARLGLQVFVEDYVHDAGYRFAAMALLNLATFGAVALGLLFVVRIVALGAAAEMAAAMMSQAMAGAR